MHVKHVLLREEYLLHREAGLGGDVWKWAGPITATAGTWAPWHEAAR